ATIRYSAALAKTTLSGWIGYGALPAGSVSEETEPAAPGLTVGAVTPSSGSRQLTVRGDQRAGPEIPAVRRPALVVPGRDRTRRLDRVLGIPECARNPLAT